MRPRRWYVKVSKIDETQRANFTITNAKLYVLAVTLTNKNHKNPPKQLELDFKGPVSWNCSEKKKTHKTTIIDDII